MLVLLLACVDTAHARSPRWLREGAVDVRFTAGQIDLPLYRGPTTRYLPTVEVQIPIDGEQRPALAVIDLAGTWSRISPEVASALGIPFEWQKIRGVWRRIAELPQVQIRDLVLEDLRVEVVADIPGLVLGIGSLPEVAVAILPSEGVVRWVPAKYGPGLIESIGTAINVTPQPTKKIRTAIGRVAGDGLTLRVPGALKWGEAEAPGTFHLRTDLETSRVAPSDRLPEPVMRSGEPFHDVGARIGDVWLPDTWIREEPGLADPAPDFAAALGYDVLFAVDLAVSPADGLVAFREARAVSWTSATPVSVEFARKRYAQEEARAAGTANATVTPEDAKVEIRFDPNAKTEMPLGDPGNAVVRDRNLDLAETLWWAGELEEAIPLYLAASQHAGDHCGAYLRLGERRLASAGNQLLDGVVGKLVVDPIARAAALWDTWQQLDADTRTAITEGRDVPDGTIQVWQPPECRIAYGLLTAVDRARGKLEDVERLEVEHLSGHPSIAYSRALVALSEGRFGGADPLLSVASAMKAVDPVDLQVAIARAKAGQSQVDAVVAITRDIPGYPTDHPLTTALGILEAARLTKSAQNVTRKLVRADDRWVPGLLVHSLATGIPPDPWDETVERRWPGSPQVACQKAVHLALTGNIREATYLLKLERWPGVADWWAANAVVASLAGDTGERDAALMNLKLRFPLLPVGTLGLL